MPIDICADCLVENHGLCTDWTDRERQWECHCSYQYHWRARFEVGCCSRCRREGMVFSAGGKLSLVYPHICARRYGELKVLGGRNWWLFHRWYHLALLHCFDLPWQGQHNELTISLHFFN